MDGPALVRRRGRQHGPALDPGQPLPRALAHLQALLDIDPVHRFVIDLPTLRPEQDMQAPIAEASALARQLLEPLAQRGPRLPARLVLPGRKVEAGQPAGCGARTDPCASTRCRTSASPRPSPPWRRVLVPSAWRKRSKTCGRKSLSMPWPVSLTVSSMSLPRRFSCTLVAPPLGVNFMALLARFQTTCCSRSGSPVM